jgi:hypothetical protein
MNSMAAAQVPQHLCQGCNLERYCTASSQALIFHWVQRGGCVFVVRKLIIVSSLAVNPPVYATVQ